MSKVEELEKAVAALGADELAAFVAWFEEFQETLFDRRIEADAKAEKLDKFAQEAVADLKAGRVRDL